MSIFISRHRTFISIFVVSAIISFSYLFEIKHVTFARLNNTFESYISYQDTSDMRAYIKNAIGLRNGNWPGAKAFFRAPLYSFFIAFVSLLNSDIFVLTLAQLSLYLATTFITYKIAKALFYESAAYIAMTLLILYGGFVFWIAIPHSTILEVFLASLSFLTLLRLRDNFNYANAGLAGIAGAILCLGRPNFIVIVPPAIAFIALEHYTSTSNIKKSILHLSFAGLCFALPLAPIILWNNLHSDHFVFFTTNGFHTYKQGNSYGAKIFSYIDTGKPLMPLTSTAFWQHLFNKFLGFWTSVEYPQNVNFYIYRLNSKILTSLPLNFGAIGSLFVAASCYFVCNFRKHWLILWFTWSYIATVAVFYIIGRFRMPIIPIMVILGAGFVCESFHMIKLLRNPKLSYKISTPQKARLLICVILFIPLFFFSKPFASHISYGDWKYTSDSSVNELDLSEYLYALNHANEINPIPRLVMNALSAEVFLGRAKEAAIKLNHILTQHPHDNYLIKTKYEILLFQKIQAGELSQTDWFSYLETHQQDHGHIAFFYCGICKLLAKREEFGFSPSFVGAYPAVFFTPCSKRL